MLSGCVEGILSGCVEGTPGTKQYRLVFSDPIAGSNIVFCIADTANRHRSVLAC